MENRTYGQVIGEGDAPFMNALAARYGLATDYHGVARPSQPNYLALISGATQGVGDDGVHDLNAKTLLDQLDAAGRGWRVYAENVPPRCFLGAAASNGPDGPGIYARKHEPAISFVAVACSVMDFDTSPIDRTSPSTSFATSSAALDCSATARAVLAAPLRIAASAWVS